MSILRRGPAKGQFISVILRCQTEWTATGRNCTPKRNLVVQQLWGCSAVCEHSSGLWVTMQRWDLFKVRNLIKQLLFGVWTFDTVSNLVISDAWAHVLNFQSSHTAQISRSILKSTRALHQTASSGLSKMFRHQLALAWFSLSTPRRPNKLHRTRRCSNFQRCTWWIFPERAFAWLVDLFCEQMKKRDALTLTPLIASTDVLQAQFTCWSVVTKRRRL